MLRPLILLLAGLLLVLVSIYLLQVTWLSGINRQQMQHPLERTPRKRLSAQLRGRWPRTIIAAGGVLAGFVLCFVGFGELLALAAAR